MTVIQIRTLSLGNTAFCHSEKLFITSDLVEIALWGHTDDSLVQSQPKLNTALKKGAKQHPFRPVESKSLVDIKAFTPRFCSTTIFSGSILVVLNWSSELMITGICKSTLGFLNLLGDVCSAS